MLVGNIQLHHLSRCGRIVFPRGLAGRLRPKRQHASERSPRINGDPGRTREHQAAKESRPMRTTRFRGAASAVLVAAGLTALAAGAQQTDIGAADKASLEKVQPSKPGYSPYAGRN